MAITPTTDELVQEILHTLGKFPHPVPVSLVHDEGGRLLHVELFYLGASADLVAKLDTICGYCVEHGIDVDAIDVDDFAMS
jgi:hypothetical protein